MSSSMNAVVFSTLFFIPFLVQNPTEEAPTVLLSQHSMGYDEYARKLMRFSLVDCHTITAD